jgi:hypothetical protein
MITRYFKAEVPYPSRAAAHTAALAMAAAPGGALPDDLALQILGGIDANAVAIAELWFGRPEVSDARDFILVLVADGVGTGIIFDGQVYRGQRGAAGEFGFADVAGCADWLLSAPLTKTIGIVDVAALAAAVVAFSVAITATCRRTKSAASSGSRLT